MDRQPAHDQEEERHQHHGRAFDSGPHAPGHDPDRSGHEEHLVADGVEAGGHFTEVVGDASVEAREQGDPRVAHGPARNHGVVGEDQEAGCNEHEAQGLPGITAVVGERPDRTLLGTAAQHQLGQQDRKPDQKRDAQVEDHERGATVLGSQVREAPHVAETDGRADGRQDEAPAAGPLLPIRAGHETSPCCGRIARGVAKPGSNIPRGPRRRRTRAGSRNAAR